MHSIVIPTTSFIVLSVLSAISTIFISIYLYDNIGKLKKIYDSMGMTMQKWSHILDRFSSWNEVLVYAFVTINFIIMICYLIIYQALYDMDIIDASLVYVPLLGFVASVILCAFHKYSTYGKSLGDACGMTATIFSLIILFGIIPMIGVEYDVIGASADYWNFTSHIIQDILIYLVVFGFVNIIIKSGLVGEKTHG